MSNQAGPLKKARIVSDFTQEDMAEKLGVTVGTICSWEKNPGKIRMEDFFDWYNMMKPIGKAVLDEYLDLNRIFAA